MNHSHTFQYKYKIDRVYKYHLIYQCCRGRKYDRSVKVTQSTKSGQVLSAKNTGSAHQYTDGVKDDFDPEDLQTELALPHNLPVSRDYLLHYSTPLGMRSFDRVRSDGLDT